MKTRLESLRKKISALSSRERILLFLAGLALLYGAWDVFLMGPLDTRNAIQQSRIEDLTTRIAELEPKIAELKRQQEFDPDRENRKRLASLNQEREKIEAELRDKAVELISPTEMAKIVEQMLAKETSLKLLGVQSLGAEAVLNEPAKPDSEVDDKEQDTENRQALVFKHGMEIRFTGDYMSVIQYMKSIEGLPQKIFWDQSRISVVDYPKSVISIRLFTLSLDKGWIGG